MAERSLKPPPTLPTRLALGLALLGLLPPPEVVVAVVLVRRRRAPVGRVVALVEAPAAALARRQILGPRLLAAVADLRETITRYRHKGTYLAPAPVVVLAVTAAPVVFPRWFSSLSPPLDLAAAVPAAAAAPPPSMTLLAPVARPPVARLLVVSDLSRARLSGLVRPRCPTPVALHAPREIHVRALGALPIPISDARGRRAGPAAPVGLLRLGLRRGLLDEDRVPREVRRLAHACRPVTRGSPVGHGAAPGLLVSWYCTRAGAALHTQRVASACSFVGVPRHCMRVFTRFAKPSNIKS